MKVTKVSIELSNGSAYDLLLPAEGMEELMLDLRNGFASENIVLTDYAGDMHFLNRGALVALITMDTYETEPDVNLDDCIPQQEEE